ncbi:hypothetical protein HF086_000705 [Spodoptera exigua]|uniref:Fibronectin type-III domain-containing protein n=1 Tax=Spodoptera exigua TaxID=7107 RepID=A0A922M4Y2_SPOEX|nr:hypothetical protein HF086_000705 [Spodoptera exigua]
MARRIGKFMSNRLQLIGIPTAPALVADSLTATSLSLVWEAPNLGNLSYMFRVAIFLSGRGGTGEPVYSAPSVVISTLESGKPSSAPTSLRAAAPDPSRVAISWEPGPFPNGPLISYVLRLADTQPNTNDALEDMPASNKTLFYMFQNLAPAREYEVSVAMRNAVGEGPRAHVKISTPPLPTSVPSQQPILILGGEQNVLAAPANDMLSDPVELYSTEYSIAGVGLDISSDSLFTSVSNGVVYRSSLSKKSNSEPILTPNNYKPQDLSVDWLNRHLYVLGEVHHRAAYGSNSTFTANWEILRCNFDGKNIITAISGFNSRPIHFEVDAYNGYLFWAQQGGDRGGLYRLDLANISNGVHPDAGPEIIVRDAHLGAFTVDHADFRILVAHLRKNTVLAVSLDGREVTDFRANTQTPMFLSTRSIAYAGGLFYWTNGKEMLTEEYHAQSDSYFHNEYPLAYNTKTIATRQVLVALRSCQPIPVPVNPPLGLQSVMGINRAKVSWSPPHLLGHQGSGAWQQWTFHLQLTHVDTGDVIDIMNITESTCVVENLKQDAEYVIRVAAVTESGSGPWSSEFVGKTLASSPNTLHSTLLWSGPDGLLQTDLTGDNLQILIHRGLLKNLHITDISWYRDLLYLVTNASTVMWYNTTTHKRGLMSNMDNVGSLAVDWVGKKIYWSNPKQQLITRGNLDGGNREPVPIVTVAKELTIDSLGAYIYWNTGHAVEAARLNGENKMIYYPAQLFSGKQVMGLTADLEEKWLYWLVRSYDGSELHRAPTADQITHGISEVSGSLVTRLSGTATLGPLCYFSGRLVWVQDASRAVVSDLAGRYTADLVPRVHVIAVRDPTLHANSVEESWLEVVSVSVAPYSSMEATVRAHTHWGGGPAARAALRSPQAPPSAPRAPRIYVQPAISGGPQSAIFRWGSPARANGVIRGYEAQCWVVGADSSSPTKPSACADAHLSPSHTQLMLRNLTPASKYFFQVRAHTDAGYGQYSEVVSASSDDVNPIPKVMVSSQESIKIIDLDSGESETIPKSTGIPVDFAVSTEENIVYWVNNLEEIFSARINGSGHFKLTSINGSASSMCVDWVSRSVYWTQLEITSVESYVTYRADLGMPNTRPHITRVFARKQPIYSLQIAPLHRTLFWYEEIGHPGLGTIMTSHLNGSDIKPFFRNSETSGRECNCPENPQVAKAFVIDMTRSKNYDLYWVDPWLHHIIATDMDACKCRVVVDATEKKKYGFTPMSITVDSRYVYWFNSTQKEIFYTTKHHKTRIEERKTAYGYKIMALDSGNQPYPPRLCLFPKILMLRPKLISNSANSITLHMPYVEKPNRCHSLEYEMSTTEYTIFYRIQLRNDTSLCDKESCSFVTTTNTKVVINDLKPFTNYTVMLEATNYYAKLHEVKPLVGTPMIIQTAAEAPTAPKDVTGMVLSPVLAYVEWKPDPGLSYEVHWRTDDSSSLAHKLIKEHNTFEVSSDRAANITRLSPGTAYVVWVRARSRHSAVWADSAPLRLRTFPPPAALALRATTPTHIRLLFRVEYMEASPTSSTWKPCTRDERNEWVATDLRPLTRYRFRLRLQYVASAPPYYWPHDDRFTFGTLGDVPGAPGPLRVESFRNGVLQVKWNEPDSRGSPILSYRVWGRPQHRISQGNENITKNLSELLPANLPSDIDDKMKMRVVREGWELLHNCTETFWLLSSEGAGGGGGAGAGAGWVARVQARNAYGWGALSPAADLTRRPRRRSARRPPRWPSRCSPRSPPCSPSPPPSSTVLHTYYTPLPIKPKLNRNDLPNFFSVSN